jgi:hypothetical protein
MIRATTVIQGSGKSYAQNFEDLVIKDLIEEIPGPEKSSLMSIVDIGASDGVSLSNSRIFVEEGFRSLLFDADANRYSKLRQNSKDFPNCSVSNEFVTPENVDFLLEGISKIGILSIDIDGLDLLILRTLIHKIPFVVVVEYNPTIPLHISFEQRPEQSNLGNSALAIHNFLVSQGYFLRHATQTNLIFSRIAPEKMLRLEDLLNDAETVRGIWVGYNGEVVFDGRQFLEFPWHGLDQRVRISGIPKVFREFFGGGNSHQFKAKAWPLAKFALNLRDRILSRLDQLKGIR